jgi:hypothetical protein
MALAISGTFLDEITHDIPGHNWGKSDWSTEFDTFAQHGLDTVILIRAGYGERLACPSMSVSRQVATLPVYADMVELFLDLAGERGIRFFLGLYDSGFYWHRYDWMTEVDINREFAKEMWDRYGGHRAFNGWYLPHETPDSSERIIDINAALAEEVRSIADLPVLVSPYWSGRAEGESTFDIQVRSLVRTADEHARIWEEIFTRYEGLVTHCAFQDGTVYEKDLPEYIARCAEAAGRHGIETWTNVETFDREMPFEFPPIEWRKLVNKLEAADGKVAKAITFEFSHFLSPNSMWPSARSLFERYLEYVRGEIKPIA